MLDLEPDVTHVNLHGQGGFGGIAAGDSVEDGLMLGQHDLAKAALAGAGVLAAMLPQQGARWRP